jgi:HSP20 family molecular chaperone IbpA
VPRFFPITLADFDRAFDELFDEMLIGRWRISAQRGEPGAATVADRGDHYEVSLRTGDVDPRQIEVEVNERRLTVRANSEQGGSWERSFAFAEAVETGAVVSRWAEHKLITTLPKKGGQPRSRRVEVGHS